MTANEAWDWVAPLGYANIVEGSDELLPNSDVFGDFGNAYHPGTENMGPDLVEVNSTGDIVWEMNVLPTLDYNYDIYRTQRFCFSPVIQTLQALEASLNESININWSIWYDCYTNENMNGSFELWLNNNLIQNGACTFPKYWLSSNLNFTLNSLPTGVYNLTFNVMDEAGHPSQNTVLIYVNTPMPILNNSDLSLFDSPVSTELLIITIFLVGVGFVEYAEYRIKKKVTSKVVLTDKRYVTQPNYQIYG